MTSQLGMELPRLHMLCVCLAGLPHQLPRQVYWHVKRELYFGLTHLCFRALFCYPRHVTWER